MPGKRGETNTIRDLVESKSVAFCPVHDAHVVRLHAMLARTLEASRLASLEALQAERRAKWEEIDARHEAEEVAAYA